MISMIRTVTMKSALKGSVEHLLASDRRLKNYDDDDDGDD